MVACCFTHGRHEEKGEEEADAGGGHIKVLENYGYIPGGGGWASGVPAHSEFSRWILVPHSTPGQHSKVNTPVNVLFISSQAEDNYVRICLSLPTGNALSPLQMNEITVVIKMLSRITLAFLS